MLPKDLRAENFSQYPPQARAFALAHLATLREMPLALLPVILREIIDYDWRFPAEQKTMGRQLQYLETLAPASFQALMVPFNAVRLPEEIGKMDWVNQPQRFSEQLSASLWAMQQMDGYREAALKYQKRLGQALIEPAPAIPRFTIAVIGQGVANTNVPLFRPLLPHGVLFTAVEPDKGMETLTGFVTDRARKHPENFAHWYIDGGQPEPACGTQEGITAVSYDALAAAALKELNLTNRFVQQTGNTGAVGPEAVQSFMAALRPADLGLQGNAAHAVQRHFEVSILTEGAGAQIFSTTFVQWSAREALRRAQPVTMLARFTPRQRMAPMNELLNRNPLTQATDPEGSLIDADMGAYYTWINQNRLAGADEARFLAWFEGHNLALAIAPGLPAGTTSAAPASLSKIIEWMSY